MKQVGDEGQGRKAKRAGQGALRKGGGGQTLAANSFLAL